MQFKLSISDVNESGIAETIECKNGCGIFGKSKMKQHRKMCGVIRL
jgi:hypothetical protein